MSNKKAVLFDTETTGTQESDRVIQLGLLVIDNLDNIRSYTFAEDLCSTTTEMSFDAMSVNHITPEMLEGKPNLTSTMTYAILESYNNNDADTYFLAHNINFDIEMLKKDGFVCSGKLIDTQRCIKHLVPEEKSYKLQYLRYKLGLYKEDEKYPVAEIMAHSALGDVFTMHQLLIVMKDIVSTKYPDADFFEKLFELSNTPVFVKKFPFGKYKDTELSLIPTDYIEWALRTLNDLGADLKFSLEETLRDRRK